jgi:hypothetical protein
MSNFTAKFLLAVAVLVFGGISAANAQIADVAIKVNIPNSFVLRDKTFPAGEYTIKRTDSTIDSPSLLLLQGEGETAIFDTIPTFSTNAAKNTELVFANVDGQYFLSKIWVKGEIDGNEIPLTRSERKLIAAGEKKEIHTVDVTGF